jgi:SecD/SecF fusion protein
MLYFSRWKTTLIWLAVLAGIVFAAPNLLDRQQAESLPDWVPSKQLTLGLDLQGGSYMLLQVEREDIIKDRLTTTVDDVRRLLREAGIGYTGLSGTGQMVQVRIRDDARVEEAKEILAELSEPVAAGLLGGGTVVEASIEETQPGQLRILLSDEGITYRVSSAVAQSIEVVRKRIDELGTTEPVIQRQGADRILVQVPGLDDPERLKSLLNQTAKLAFRMVDTSMPVQEAIDGRPPATSEVLFSTDDPPIPYLIQRSVLVSGENLVDAQAGYDQRTNEPIVTFRFDSKGGQRFGQATTQNVGLPFAIVLDEQVISAPVIREPISGRHRADFGQFHVESANDLAILLRAGALPATLTVIEERTVGPAWARIRSRPARSPGLSARCWCWPSCSSPTACSVSSPIWRLIANVSMIIAILTMLGATLTLPGIAGIVLTVGMAVDSNVLIYERIREEHRAGRSLIQAIDAGFSRAFSTILDANITTLIAAIILFYLGTGPVRGFAVTLAIGIVTTVFTAFTFTRWMVAEWVRRKRPEEHAEGPA